MWWTALAWASQSDVVLPIGAAFERTSANVAGDVLGVPRVAGGAGLGIHPLASSPQVWEGTAFGDVTLLGIGERAALGGSLSQQTSADGANDIYFRLTRLYYDAALGADVRLGAHHGLSLGYRHRCSHGTDDVDGRILIRSGPALGWEGAWGTRTLVRATATLEPTLIGQNADLQMQPRALLAAAARVSHPLRERLHVLATAGLGGLLVSSGPDDLWGLGAPMPDARIVPLPTGAIGLGTDEARVLLHGERMADTGLGDAAVPVALWSFRVEFGT